MFSVEVRGLDQLQSKLRVQNLSSPFRNFFQRATLLVQRFAAPLVPVDTGRLRGSLATEVDASPLPSWGRTGSNVDYGIYVHEGTSPHFPPPQALEGWAQRHGIENGYVVARAISRRGTKPNRFLLNGAKKALGGIKGLVGQLAKEIEASFG